MLSCQKKQCKLITLNGRILGGSDLRTTTFPFSEPLLALKEDWAGCAIHRMAPVYKFAGIESRAQEELF